MVREHTSVLAESEKRLLVRMAGGLPAWVNSDHLTSLGAIAMVGVGLCFWAGGSALLLVIPLLALNWFGDSLDGTLARVRNRQRPRYGYYVDHVLDAVGFACLFGGLMLGRPHEPRRSGSRSWRPTTCWWSRSRSPPTRAGPSSSRS